jgi:hypothetical protein
MSVSKSGYYDWHNRPENVINLGVVKLYRLLKQIVKKNRGSLRNSEMVKSLRKEGYQVGCYLVRKIMHRLRLKATQKVTTQRKLSDAVADKQT